MNLLETSLSEISQELPGATAIFNHYNLSFCCGGKKILQDAINNANLDQTEVLGALLKLMDQSDESINWDEASDEDLTVYLKTLTNTIYNTQLPELFRLADRVEKVHGDKPDCPVGLASQLNIIIAKLKAQIEQDNKELYPQFLNKQTIESNLVDGMRTNLDDMVVAILKIDELTNNISTPEGACNTWRALYLGLRTFKVDIQQYIRLENDTLFTRISNQAKTHGEDFCCGSCGGS